MIAVSDRSGSPRLPRNSFWSLAGTLSSCHSASAYAGSSVRCAIVMELLTQQSSASILCGCFCAPVSMEISSGGVAAPIVTAASVAALI